jgi:hypothetical protein
LLLLRLGRKIGYEAIATTLKDYYQRLLNKREKLSVFFTFGGPGAGTAEFCRFEFASKLVSDPEFAVKLIRMFEGSGIGCHPLLMAALREVAPDASGASTMTTSGIHSPSTMAQSLG